MFSINNSVTAAINILSAIHVLESAQERLSPDVESILITDHELDLLSEGIVNARYVVTSHGQQVPGLLSLISVRRASSSGLPRQQVEVLLRELKHAELLAEGGTPPIHTALSAIAA